jgi:seryl-tRNA synthetase
MFDLKFVREHAEELRDTVLRQRRDDRLAALDDALRLDKEWRSLKQETDTLRKERNEVSERINQQKKEGKPVDELIARAKEIPLKIKEHEERLAKLEGKAKTLLARIPNIMHKEVPYGTDETGNKETKRWGRQRDVSFPMKNHVELAEALGLADFDASAKTSGHGFYFLKGDLALLNQALIRFAVEKLVAKGYAYIEPPLMVREEVLEAAMDLAGIRQSIYEVGGAHDDGKPENRLRLIGTAEHALLGMHASETLKGEELPKRYVGYSMCFRQEIGSHGINEKGLWRTHQFNKVEQFIFCLPEQSWEMYAELLRNSEEILQQLKLPYRVVEICTGDLAPWKARSHDLEVWRPTTKGYGEVMSLSNCTTYQAHDLDIRYVRKNGERGVVHTLNNTALATSRIMVAILENCQERDGTVTIPEALRPYMNGKAKLRPQR